MTATSFLKPRYRFGDILVDRDPIYPGGRYMFLAGQDYGDHPFAYLLVLNAPTGGPWLGDDSESIVMGDPDNMMAETVP